MKEHCSTIPIDGIVSLSWWEQEVIAQAMMKTPNPAQITVAVAVSGFAEPKKSTPDIAEL